MIKFFRKIRQSLLNEGKTKKYFFYAIGEIILVVIGILIALQINNYNETVSNEARFVSVLKEIKTDLETDILNAKRLLKDGEKVDSLMRKVLDGELTIKDYKNEKNRRLFYLGLYHYPYEYQTTGFHKFESFQGLVPEKYSEITKLITQHYTKEGKNFNTAHNISKEISRDRQNYLIQNFSWYHLLEKKESPDDMIAFYLKNPIYKNWIYHSYNYNTLGVGQSLDDLQKSAINLVALLSSSLDVEVTNPKLFKDILGEPLDASDKALQGTYKVIGGTREFSLNTSGVYLIFKDKSIQGFLKKTGEDQYQGVQYPNWYYNVIRDDNGKIMEFVMKDTGRNKIYRCKKIQ
ncbi:MAG: hypothetical protein JXQ93_02885 [Flavobacteriaceae bacterium]